MSKEPTPVKTTRLSAVTQLIQYGYTAKSSYQNAGPKYLRITDIQNDHVEWSQVPHVTIGSDDRKRYLLRAGDIVFARSGATVGKSFLIRDDPGEAVFASYLIRVRCDSALLDSEYAALYFKSKDYWTQIVQGATGTGQPNFNGTKLGDLCIPLRSIKEQGHIVTKLTSLLHRSRNARAELARIPRLVERHKQAILTAAFRGDLTANWRKCHAGNASNFLKREGMLHLDAQDLPQVPNGWSWVAAGTLCAIKSGITLGKKRPRGIALIERPYLRVANVQRGWLNLDEIKTIAVTEKEAAALYLQPGDVLMNEGGDRDKLGRGWVWNGQIKQCIHQNHVFRLRPRIPELPSKYLSYYANEFGQNYFLREGKQTTNLASISMSKISALPIPIAPPDEMARIVALIEDGFAAIDKIAAEATRASDLLDRLDQAILAKAFAASFQF